MFNRGNIPNPFGSSGQSNPNQAPPRYDTDRSPSLTAGYAAPTRDADVPMTDVYDTLSGYGGPPPPGGRPPPQQMPSRMQSGQRGGGPTWTLHPSKSPNDNYTFGNL
jgi:vesicle-fusing ATPase